MLDKTTHRIQIVQARDPASFERKYNAVADEVDEYDPEITVQLEGGVYYAIFKYTLHKLVPQTVSDEFTVAGITHTCSECPYLEIGTDNRRKNWPCKYAEYGTASVDQPACEILLRKLMQGTVRLRNTEEGYDE